jgi:DNA-binding CsgD family transcriptional regulator
MGTFTARDRARAGLASLARSQQDSDSFRREAIAIVHRAIGVDGWGWLQLDPGAGMPMQESNENVVCDKELRRFFRMMPQVWNVLGTPDGRPAPLAPAAGAPPVTTLSAATGGDLARDLTWREVFGPGGVGDKMRVQLIVGGTCWALLHLHRDITSAHYGEDDVEFAAAAASLLAPRVRADLRAPVPPGPDPAPEPGTIVLDEELSLVAATARAGWWIDHLGAQGPNPDEPLPSVVYVVATQVANSPERPRRPARLRLRAADGSWMIIRVAPLATGAQTMAGYAVTLEAAPAAELAPLLMRAWGLTRREREVARLVIDGLSSEDIAAALFISVHTVRDHLKTIFGKVGVGRRQDLVAALTGQFYAPGPAASP